MLVDGQHHIHGLHLVVITLVYGAGIVPQHHRPVTQISMLTALRVYVLVKSLLLEALATISLGIRYAWVISHHCARKFEMLWFVLAVLGAACICVTCTLAWPWPCFAWEHCQGG